MNSRTTHRTVTFTRPFRLGGIDGVMAPGKYEVDIDEEQIEGLTMVAWRRVATSIAISREGATQIHRIDPVDLDASLLRDAGLASPSAESEPQFSG
jgi:hypothetical protein